MHGQSRSPYAPPTFAFFPSFVTSSPRFLFALLGSASLFWSRLSKMSRSSFTRV